MSFHVSGNLRLATNRERLDEYYKYCATANTIGVPFRIITPAEVQANLRDTVQQVQGHIDACQYNQALEK